MSWTRSRPAQDGHYWVYMDGYADVDCWEIFDGQVVVSDYSIDFDEFEKTMGGKAWYWGPLVPPDPPKE